MLRNPTIAADRAWNSWSSRPLEMVFLPLGVRITPLAFSGSTGKATLFPSGPTLLFGRHELDGSVIEAQAAHAKTTLSWSYQKPDPYRIVGAWRSLTQGEWGLRFWINLCLSAESGAIVEVDPASGAALVKIGSRWVALVGGENPVQITGHATIEAAAADYEQHGYFDTRSRSLAAPVIMLRYNLEMMPAARFAAAVGDDRALALAEAQAALKEPSEVSVSRQTGRHAGSLDAIRDVMGWNTVWDTVNDRVYTSISRNWNLSKFGGFGVWLDDQFYHALLCALIDPDLARDNVAVALANATPQGNLACLLTANDAWVDRTQIPVGAFVVWLIYRRVGGRDFLARAYNVLARNHAWWWRERDPDRLNLCSYGTSGVGEALYQGTSFGARNESSMDNSPIHDEAAYDPATRTLTTIDVGLNSLLALDAEMLSLIAGELGFDNQATQHAAIAARTRDLVRDHLWDETRGIFANRLRGGGFVRSIGPTSFYPLAAGAASDAQRDCLLSHLDDKATFGGTHVIPSISRDDPAYPDNVYWRGRVWPPLNYFVWQGLRRYGCFARASALAEASLDLFRGAWAERRLCPENYNAETGEPLDQADTEGFYGWGALMPLMGVAEISDISPWHGWDLVNTGQDVRLGPMQSPAGPVVIRVENGWLSVLLACEMASLACQMVLLASNVRGRITDIVWERSAILMSLPPIEHDDTAIEFPGIPASKIARITLNQSEVVGEPCGSGIRIPLGPAAQIRRLAVYRL